MIEIKHAMRIVLVILAGMVVFPREAHVSGTVRLSAVADMVYVEVTQGLRVHRGSPQQIENARESNAERIRKAQNISEKDAAAVRDALLTWQKTQTPPVQFQSITEKPYQPSEHDVRLNEKPLVIARFAVIPSSAAIQSASTTVQKALSAINQE